jgi:hypothetical protein
MAKHLFHQSFPYSFSSLFFQNWLSSFFGRRIFQINKNKIWGHKIYTNIYFPGGTNGRNFGWKKRLPTNERNEKKGGRRMTSNVVHLL